MTVVRKTLACLALGATAFVSVSGAAKADDFHRNNRFTDGEFTVDEVVNDATGRHWCSMQRGQFRGPTLAVTLDGLGMQMILSDPETHWVSGEVVLRIGDRHWTAPGTANLGMVAFHLESGPQLVDFLTAMATTGTTLSIYGPAQPNGGATPAKYDVSLTGAKDALNAEMECARAAGSFFLWQSAPVAKTVD
jgi:hypothetical protein